MNAETRLPLCVLYIDDSYDDHHLVHRAIERANLPLRLEPFFTAEEALNYLHHRSPFDNQFLYPAPDLIICDYKLATCKAPAFLPVIRGIDNSTPILVLSDFDGAIDVAAAYSAGADHYLLKPTAVEELKVLFAILYTCMRAAPPNFSALSLLEEYLAPNHVPGLTNWRRRQWVATEG